MQDQDALVLGDNYVQGVFYTPSRGHRGAFHVKLDDEGFALAVEMTQIIGELYTRNETNNILYDIQGSLFTILSAANMLQANYTPNTQQVSEAMEFLNTAIPDFANGSEQGWRTEATIREVFSKISTYALRFILDSMSTTLKEIQDDEGDVLDLAFLIGDIASLLSVRYLIPLPLRNKLEDLKNACFNLEVENEE
ncbi:hypothetical protein [Candidatus Nanosynbacter sp. HMT-352]|jgi:hypothetical protein|uniref:hypothetical protein n=1 Tax=Candidatus Nanosynbacter sp. HMT-352 TaxID=2899133 RepID=UPI001E5E06AA|nr:hypothetical protein [Candidatus Nanosynbacter sp. HMT-352]UHA57618.1 hypothetical protein LR957_01280 [Candidatus Nanosynbacter sp. HMT-352]